MCNAAWNPDGGLPPPFGYCPAEGVQRPIEANGTCSGCGTTVFVQTAGNWLLKRVVDKMGTAVPYDEEIDDAW